MARRPPQQAPCRARDEQPPTIPARRSELLALFLELRVVRACCCGEASRLRPARDPARSAVAAAGSEAAARPRAPDRGPAPARSAAEPVEPRPFLLELHAQPGELTLDLADRLLALVEPLALGLGEGELLHGLALAFLGLGDLAGELIRAIGAGGCERLSRPPPALPAGDLEPQLLELLLARGDALRVLAQLRFISSTSASACLVAAPHVQPVAHRWKCVFQTGWWQPSTDRRARPHGRAFALMPRRYTAAAMMARMAEPELQVVADGVVTLKAPGPGGAQLLVEGRDDEFFRWLGPGAESPNPVACVWAGEELVGWVDYDLEWDWLEPGEANVGYYLFRGARGKGHASRAVERGR